MNLGWKAANINRDKGIAYGKIRQEKIRYCKICGKPANAGQLCRTCNEFINRKKKEERMRTK